MSLEERVQRLEDLHAIGQLRAQYCQLLDDCRWDELVELFTEDGCFDGLSTVHGRPALRAFFPDLLQGSLDAWWHFSSNETIELDGDTATGQTWLYQPCVVEGVAHIAAGRYTDSIVRCPDGAWRFAVRRVRFFYWVTSGAPWFPGRYDYPAAELSP